MTPASAPTIVLWDIDGTLLRTPQVGVRAFVLAIERAAGVTWAPRRLDFGGRTDQDIAALILADAGVEDIGLVPGVLDALVEAYVELDAELRETVVVMPGVDAALTGLAARDAVQTVVTGNVRAAALAKLTAAGLEGRLRHELGGYGSDHVDRPELVRLALERVAAAGHDVVADRVWVIGDTPRDHACAVANGVRSMLVATGSYAVDELTGLGADIVVDDLTDLATVVSAIGA